MALTNRSRREFLEDVGRGMLVASVGATLADDLGLSPAWAGETTTTLQFGRLEPLVVLMQESSPDKLLPTLVEKLKRGTELRTLVAAAALANARTFGGQDYIGFHAFMALAPAFHMAQEMPSDQAPLPVLKVIYRNTNRIQACGGRAHEMLHPIEPDELAHHGGDLEPLQQAERKADMEGAERTFAALARGPIGEAFNHLQFSVQDEVDVHRVVLAWRAWASLDLTGQEYAHTLLRQSVRYCVEREQESKKQGRAPSEVRALLPKLLDQYKLLGAAAGQRRAEDGWIEKLGRLIADSPRPQAADAVAAALGEGFSAEDVGAAISLAANGLLLRDPGRDQAAGPNGDKPIGSCHGDSVGVHASDAANAWRNIARVSNQRNAVASLIVGAFHTAGQAGRVKKERFPLPEHLEKVVATGQESLLRELEAAVKEKDQFRCCAIVERYGQLDHAPRPVFDLLLRYGVSEDGSLHAEKYYWTAREEFDRSRPAFRWRQLVALARVTASEYGHPAPGYAQACELLKV